MRKDRQCRFPIHLFLRNPAAGCCPWSLAQRSEHVGAPVGVQVAMRPHCLSRQDGPRPCAWEGRAGRASIVDGARGWCEGHPVPRCPPARHDKPGWGGHMRRLGGGKGKPLLSVTKHGPLHSVPRSQSPESPASRGIVTTARPCGHPLSLTKETTHLRKRISRLGEETAR